MIKSFFIHLIANALALYGISYLLHGNFLVTGGWKGYLIAGLIIGLVNSVVKPLLKLLRLPLMFLTLGGFSIVLNILLLLFSKYLLSVLAFDGVSLVIIGLINYLYAAILISVANIIVHWIPTK